ncbi:hypothetical protein [Pseudomonas xionganensis]|uniref:Uncharacterized protein n=1 Tax=Pseudomonas xionganensis TaxID=2654845 RepID=A0A6I4KY23_9PSED|nr:hypothetical protein [Pseudomonas xionganensis]MVW75692.1 hypothetical protein [Pseudomonas xionganensis]
MTRSKNQANLVCGDVWSLASWRADSVYLITGRSEGAAMTGISAEVSLVVGQAHALTSEGASRDLAQGTQVSAGEQLIAGESGAVVLLMSDGMRVILAHGSGTEGRAAQLETADLSQAYSALQQEPDPHHALAVPQAIDHVLFLIEQTNGEIMGARLDYPVALAVTDSFHPRQYEAVMGQLFDGQVETYFIKAGMLFYSDFGWPIDPLDPGLGAEAYLNVIDAGPYAGSPLSFSGVEFALLEGDQAFLLGEDGFTNTGAAIADTAFRPEQVMHVVDVAALGFLSADDLLLHTETSSGRIDLDALLESSLGLQGGQVDESAVRISAVESGALLEVDMGETSGGFVALATLGNLSAGDQVILLLGGSEHSIAVT